MSKKFRTIEFEVAEKLRDILGNNYGDRTTEAINKFFDVYVAPDNSFMLGEDENGVPTIFFDAFDIKIIPKSK